MYYTIDDWFRANAWRHASNAISYISAGYPDRFWQGSLRKAKRNFKKAEEFTMPEFLKEIVDNLSNKISDAIINGTSDAKSNAGTGLLGD